MAFKFFDVHSHIYGREYDADREKVLSRMKEKGVATIAVGTHKRSSEEALKLSLKCPEVFASVGLHPTDTKEEFDVKFYQELAKNKKIVAIGECGLDYFRLGDDAAEEKKRQRGIFEEQLKLSVEIGKPLMIHCRPSGKSKDAHEEMIKILSEKKKKYGDKLRGNIHFFTGQLDTARCYIDLGFTVSLPGVITFAPELNDLVKGLPLSSILSETDSPYATPTPFRGERNEPSYVEETVKAIAVIRGEDLEMVKKALVLNTLRTFQIAGTT